MNLQIKLLFLASVELGFGSGPFLGSALSMGAALFEQTSA